MNSNTFKLRDGSRRGAAGLKVVSGRGAFRLPAGARAPKPAGEPPPKTEGEPPRPRVTRPKDADAEGNAVPGFYSMRYKLVKRIRGGQAVVYKAHDRELGMDVALKFLPGRVLKKEQRLEELKREATIAMRLTHENIVRLYTIEMKNAHPFLVMEFVEGETIRKIIDRAGPLAVETVLGVARACGSALEYAHKHGVLHRDLKPENIMITAGGHLKVLDFGAATTVGSILAEYIEGTPGYMAPEQVAGRSCDVRADIFALGVVLWEMLTGRNAFPERTDLQHMYDKPPVDGERVPGPIREVLARAMCVDPAGRWATVAEFNAALVQAAGKVS